MKAYKVCAALALSLPMLNGCSAETKQETKEALKETGEAVSSAVEDTKENVQSAADDVKEKLSDAADKEPSTDVDADAESAPDSQEP